MARKDTKGVKKPRRPLAPKICVVCGKGFFIKAYREAVYKVCSTECRVVYRRHRQTGANNSNWRHESNNYGTGHSRAIATFTLEPCVVCGSEKSERHHIDGNYMNNERSNIMFLCRKHHMQEDGRMAKWLARNVERGREQT